MSRWVPQLASTLAVAGVITAQDFALPADQFPPSSPTVSAAADSDADTKAKPIVVMVPQQVEVLDESGPRRKLARLQAEHAKLYTGDELAALITQAEQAIEDRKTELAERKKSFDEKIEAVRAQLEELEKDAAAVGADVPIGLMLNALDDAKKAKGTPRNEVMRPTAPADAFEPRQAPLTFDSFAAPKPKKSPAEPLPF